MRYIPILMYHYIREVDQTVDPMGYRLSVSPTQFAAQLAWLAQEGYVTLRMDEAAACLQGKRGCPPRAIVLTFDDGYMDAYTDALPLLQKHGFVATFYVVAAFIGEHGYMGWDELEQLRDAGMEIGSHTLTHPNLTILSRDQASYEILHSAEIIGGNLQVPMHSFCYPIGKFTPLVKSLVQEAGYTNAVTTMQSGYQGDGYALPRLRISGEMGQLGFESMITSYTPAMPTSQGTPSP
jgi:peptidoglycan/xylan/chitin deacetylase (PgdA/CDA1 family)